MSTQDYPGYGCKRCVCDHPQTLQLVLTGMELPVACPRQVCVPGNCYKVCHKHLQKDGDSVIALGVKYEAEKW